MGPSGNGLVGADERGRNPAESRAYRMDAPVRFQKAVPGLKENVAVERREARRSALWIGSSLPLEGQAQPQGGHGAAIRTAPVGALPPRSGGLRPQEMGANSQTAAGRRTPRSGGAVPLFYKMRNYPFDIGNGRLRI